MSKSKTFRFAAGSSSAPFSCVWRLVVSKNEVYLGSSKSAMSVFKLSLHSSGVWVLSGTQQSGAVFENGNRRAKTWRRPLEHVDGITRGPSILVPHTSLGARQLESEEDAARITWYPAPFYSSLVDFSLYFVRRATTTSWTAGELTLAECPLADGGRVILLASTSRMTAGFRSACEKVLSESVFGVNDLTTVLRRESSLLWYAGSRDSFRIPMIVDMPLPMRYSRSAPAVSRDVV
jgi:hypothetical protein